MDFLAQRCLFEDMSLCITVYHNQQSRADTPSLRDSNSLAFFFYFGNPLPILHCWVPCWYHIAGGNCRDFCIQVRFVGTERIISWVQDVTAQQTWEGKADPFRSRLQATLRQLLVAFR